MLRSRVPSSSSAIASGVVAAATGGSIIGLLAECAAEGPHSSAGAEAAAMARNGGCTTDISAPTRHPSAKPQTCRVGPPERSDLRVLGCRVRGEISLVTGANRHRAALSAAWGPRSILRLLGRTTMDEPPGGEAQAGSSGAEPPSRPAPTPRASSAAGRPSDAGRRRAGRWRAPLSTASTEPAPRTRRPSRALPTRRQAERPTRPS